MNNRKYLMIGLIILITLGMGCIGNTSPKSIIDRDEMIAEQNSINTQDPINTENIKPTPISTINKEDIQKTLLLNVTTGSVSTANKNWDADAEDDGIVIFPALKDDSGNSVEYKNTKLPVNIYIYTTKTDPKTLSNIKDRLVYNGSAYIHSWEDGNQFTNGGIRISYENINVTESDREFGIVHVETTLPDGRIIYAESDFFNRIKPVHK